MSPELFIIVFNSLLVMLKAAGFDVFAYADDLVITQNVLRKLKRAINIVEKWT